MFNKDQFVQDCLEAAAQGQAAIHELVAGAVSDGPGVIRELGEPEHAGVFPLYRSPGLTIINFAWAPCMSLMPHNHQMYAVIGIYTGREDNIFWRRTPASIEASGARSLGTGDVASLDSAAIHSVLNPIGKMTCAIHVYGGDFFAPHEPRSEWDHETLKEGPWDIEKVKKIFSDSEARFKAGQP
jgi:predicted metal-dependent enzyme (double-stranded beta helix superfamily)